MSEIEEEKLVEVAIGECCEFYDEHGQRHYALVTEVFGDFGVWTQEESDRNVELGGAALPVGESKPIPSINVVYVSSDPNQGDQYGRQIVRETSVVHVSVQPAHGMYWK